ncbi:MAG: sulfite exporter TauE/SafE family protein [SAR324 cluster bacterium]|nr:sulfite exporter TauE/SafE family protein [SAR324 cluster bacterium]MED5434980.1 sulfite exporter TauE/SafE family protein [SAR324 cluster bacterium]
MFEESLYFSAFLIGLLGGTHCAGMCGGIISGLTLGVSEENRRKNLLPFSLLYNFGRIISYSVAGAMVTSLGTISDNYGFGIEVRKILTLLAATIMIFLGLYLTGWWITVILKIEKIGTFLWQRIEPYAKRYIPIRSKGHALIAGLLWGWLPCGLVYSTLFLAMSGKGVAQGVMVMTSFGIGTLPALLTIGYFSDSLIAHLQKKWIRTFAGIMIVGFGIFQFKIHFFS